MDETARRNAEEKILQAFLEKAPLFADKILGQGSYSFHDIDEQGRPLSSEPLDDPDQPYAETRWIKRPGAAAPEPVALLAMGPQSAAACARLYALIDNPRIDPAEFAQIAILHEIGHGASKPDADRELASFGLSKASAAGAAAGQLASKPSAPYANVPAVWETIAADPRQGRAAAAAAMRQTETAQTAYEEAYADAFAIQKAGEIASIPPRRGRLIAGAMRETLARLGLSDAEHDTRAALALTADPRYDTPEKAAVAEYASASSCVANARARRQDPIGACGERAASLSGKVPDIDLAAWRDKKNTAAPAQAFAASATPKI